MKELILSPIPIDVLMGQIQLFHLAKVLQQLRGHIELVLMLDINRLHFRIEARNQGAYTFPMILV